MREKGTDRACGTLALAIKGFSSRLECMEFFSDVKAIEVGSQVLVGKAGARHHIWFRRTDRPGQPARVEVTAVNGSGKSFTVKMSGEEKEYPPEYVRRSPAKSSSCCGQHEQYHSRAPRAVSVTRIPATRRHSWRS